MAKKHKPEEIVAKLRQVDVLTFSRDTDSGCGSLDRGDGGDVLPLAQ